MPDPITLKMKHAEITLEPGTFAWCTCGKTATPPFCDGTHRGTKFKSVLFKLPEKRKEWLCQGDQTTNAASTNRMQMSF